MRRQVGAISVVTLLLAIGGVAKGGLKERSVEFTVDDEVERTAQCDSGQEAIAGGFYGLGATYPVLESKRIGSGGWSYRLDTASAPSPATAYVYCDKREPGLKTKTVTTTLDDQYGPPIPVRCRRGQVAVSGGFDFPLSEAVVVASKRAGKRTWEVQFVGPVDTEVTVFAYCDKAEPRLKVREASTIPPPEGGSVVASCKRKQKLRSGGFETEYGETGGSSWPDGSRRDGKRGWEVHATAVSAEAVITAYAYCTKKKKRK